MPASRSTGHRPHPSSRTLVKAIEKTGHHQREEANAVLVSRSV
jgi:hypothetical protein